MEGEVEIRRATADDYDSVMAIIDDLYYGQDYLPTMYHVFLQTKRHVFYVAKSSQHGRMVSFFGARITDDEQTAMTMSGRTAKEVRSSGLNKQMMMKLTDDFPSINGYLYDGLVSESSQKMRSLGQIQYLWTALIYQVPAHKMPEFKSSSSSNVKSLSVSESVELVKTGVCERLLRRFAVDYVPSDNYWAPVRLVESDLLEMVKKASHVLVTFDPDGGREISSISFSNMMLLKTKLRSGQVLIDLHFFGSEISDLMEHARMQLSCSVAVTGGRDVNVVVHFPSNIDQAAASESFSADVFRGVIEQGGYGKAYLASIKQ